MLNVLLPIFAKILSNFAVASLISAVIILAVNKIFRNDDL